MISPAGNNGVMVTATDSSLYKESSLHKSVLQQLMSHDVMERLSTPCKFPITASQVKAGQPTDGTQLPKTEVTVK